MPKIRSRHIKRELSGEKAKDKIERLSIDEKKIIIYMYRHQADSIVLPSTSSAVIHLENNLMISKATNIGQHLGKAQIVSYFLQQWVIQSLENNSDLMKGIPDRLPEDIERYSDFIEF